MENTPPFLGTGWSFPPTFLPGLYGVSLVTGEDDIRQSLHILLTTTVGERLMHPDYGCDLRPYLFEPVNTTLLAYIRDLVKSAILMHEPRIKLDSVTIEDRTIEGQMIIHVDYIIRTTNTRHNFVYPFYRTEATELPK